MSVAPLKIMLVAGEPSGDALGAELIKALRRLEGDRLTLIGSGGPLMRREGFVPLFGLEDTAVMGLREVVPKVPAILRRVRQARDLALTAMPDATVLIDSPDFTHRVARAIRKRAGANLRLIKYVAPQVWASRPERAQKMRAFIDHVLCLLPFEPPFFEKYGLPASFVGHPVIERSRAMTGGDAFRARHGIGPSDPLLLVLPGSRTSEIGFLLPVFRKTVELLARDVPGLRCVLPVVPNVAAKVKAGIADWPVPLTLIEDPTSKFQSFDAADVAFAASGTVTTELALSRTPMLVGYKVGALTAAIARRMVKVKYITLVNLILDREAVPELVQENLTPRRAAEHLRRLFLDEGARKEQVESMEAATKALGEGGESPSLRAAREILRIAGEGGPQRTRPIAYQPK
ncbi:MAG: lipid-A-disaccharide synthase [Alphaproteobacteria bacterium]|nr:lipid-A-disaccharide synthase [Alphaproteobacteria bacterium]